MKKLLSHIYPITRKVTSEFNATLEITWYNGKKHLNTQNANYSYGSLQRILKYGLEKIDLKKVNSVLLLGLGGGSVIETLWEDFNYKKPITAIDIDPVIIKIAEEEYQIKNEQNLKIICEDAFKYVTRCDRQFDLIIIDLFIDVNVPKQFLELPFWTHILKVKSGNGCILFNASLEKSKSNALHSVIEFLKTKVYHVEVYEKVNDTNTIVITQSL